MTESVFTGARVALQGLDGPETPAARVGPGHQTENRTRKSNRSIPMTRTNRKGFTLIEILIVVIILGILAAIVIPQFTNASKEAKQSALVTMVQSMRSQIALFKLQHNDFLPGASPLVGTGGAFTSDTFWSQMTEYTSVTGTFVPGGMKDATYAHGPYMQSIPKNPLCPNTLSSSLVVATAAGVPSATVCGFIYDFQGGAGSGKLWGTNTDGLTAIAQ
jgi:general secretion pathway protein G